MKKIIVYLSLIGSVLLFTGCGVLGGNGIMVQASGNVVMREFEMEDFTAFNIGGSYNVTFRYGDEHLVIIEMSENLFEHIEVTVSRDTLTIETTRGIGINFGNEQPHVTIYAPFIDHARLSGSASAIEWDPIVAPSFTLETSGSSDVMMAITTEELSVKASGSANIELSGSADVVDMNFSGSTSVIADLVIGQLSLAASGSSVVDLVGVATSADMNLSGSNNILAFEMQMEEVSIQASGSATVEIAVSQTLDVTARESSRIRYIGNPVITQETSGSATITPN